MFRVVMSGDCKCPVTFSWRRRAGLEERRGAGGRPCNVAPVRRASCSLSWLATSEAMRRSAAAASDPITTCRLVCISFVSDDELTCQHSLRVSHVSGCSSHAAAVIRQTRDSDALKLWTSCCRFFSGHCKTT